MLKGIDPVISPELLKVLAEMGHGDTIVLADAHFPATSIGQRIVRADGHGTLRLVKAVLELIPLDTYIEKPVTLMEVVAGDRVETPIWNDYIELLHKENIGFLDRFDFYEQAQQAYAVVATGEVAQYANLILTKGVVV
ncbi:L-fucose mutarotase [Auritidibacter sp. NML130574]|uniref:L-fucose mutarotase n=1 Tax=Auritidibacter sp. NML130574 TaxID=2170745 RepID=UPI000D730B05|nr:L-fucose mutarotase [Auritidibacter sp. NML130574]AXR74678.1 L-fucose mutarotase [Auritidibacter sp. NML130574]